jgi:hypothetical protein
MLSPLCSLARNPDGTFVRPTAYEINAAISNKLALAALGLFAIGLFVAFVTYRVRLRRTGLVLAAGGALLMALHPAWMVSMSGGDCGALRQDCSWIVLGLMGAFVGINLVLLACPTPDRDIPNRLDYDDSPTSEVPQ